MIKPIIVALPVVPNEDKYDKLHSQLEQMAAGANTSCKDFTSLLEEFGFIIRDAGKHGHKVVTHPAILMRIEDRPNYNCGHSPNKKMLPVYVKKFLRITNNYESNLREHLK